MYRFPRAAPWAFECRTFSALQKRVEHNRRTQLQNLRVGLICGPTKLTGLCPTYPRCLPAALRLPDDFFFDDAAARPGLGDLLLADLREPEAERPVVDLPAAILAADFPPPKIFSQLSANLREAPECSTVMTPSGHGQPWKESVAARSYSMRPASNPLD